MASRDHRAHWIAAENIARFEHQLTTERDTCERKMLEGLLVLEREKLRALNEGEP
jgi:hypothetical protein